MLQTTTENLIWYPVLTAPRKEEVAVKGLEKLGFEVLFLHHKKPLVCRGKPVMNGEGKQKTRKVPYFHRYLFIGATPDHNCYWVKFTPGVSTMLFGEFGPYQVPAHVVEDMKANADEDGCVGTIKRPEKAKRKAQYKRGDTIKLKTGPLRGMPLTVIVDMGRSLWLNVQGSIGRIEVSASALEADGA